MYEWMLDWAARLRAASVPQNFEEVIEATACFADTSAEAIRDFIDAYADQLSRLPELAAGARVEHPLQLESVLKLTVDPGVKTRHRRALGKLSRELSNSQDRLTYHRCTGQRTSLSDAAESRGQHLHVPPTPTAQRRHGELATMGNTELEPVPALKASVSDRPFLPIPVEVCAKERRTRERR
jgi:hypothetical protein